MTLTAAADSGSQFGGWTGDPDCNTGRLTMNGDKSCTAVFQQTATPTPMPTVMAAPTNTPTPQPTVPPGTGPERVVNGSFETPNIGGTNVTLAQGQTLGGNWMVDTETVDHVGSFWQAASGSQSIDLNGNTAGAIYQDIATIPGQSYRLRFAVAGNPDINQPPFQKQLQVRWGSTVIDNIVFDVSGRSNGNMGWRYHQYVVTATQSITRLRLASLTGGTAGPTLDDVSIR